MNLNAKNVGGACLIIHGSKSNNCARVALGDVTSHASLVSRRVKNVHWKKANYVLWSHDRNRGIQRILLLFRQSGFGQRLVQSYHSIAATRLPRLGL